MLGWVVVPGLAFGVVVVPGVLLGAVLGAAVLGAVPVLGDVLASGIGVAVPQFVAVFGCVAEQGCVAGFSLGVDWPGAAVDPGPAVDPGEAAVPALGAAVDGAGVALGEFVFGLVPGAGVVGDGVADGLDCGAACVEVDCATAQTAASNSAASPAVMVFMVITSREMCRWLKRKGSFGQAISGRNPICAAYFG